MALIFSHGNARMTYAEFGRLRRRLAKEINIVLGLMDGYNEKPEQSVSWNTVNDSIKILLTQPDNDGEIPPDVCASISKRIRELTVSWDKSDIDFLNASMLADGLDEAASKNVFFAFT